MKYLLTAFLLFESLYTITLPCDPIHREDYRGAIHYLNQECGSTDAMMTVQPEFMYYFPQEPKLHEDYLNAWPYDLEKLPEKFKRVFIMSNYSMMSANNAKDLRAYEEKLPGFHLEHMEKFGGQDGHTVVYVFRRNSAPRQ